MYATTHYFYSNAHLTRLLSPKATTLYQAKLRCNVIIKYYLTDSLKRVHSFYKAIFALQKGLPYKGGRLLYL